MAKTNGGCASDFETMIRELGRKTPELKRRVVKALVDFEAARPIQQELRHKDARKWLRAVSATSRKLADLLEKDAKTIFTTAPMEHPWTDLVLQKLLTQTHATDDPQKFVIAWSQAKWKATPLIKDLRTIAKAAADKRLFPFIRGDTRRHWHLQALVVDLASVYQECTGRLPGRDKKRHRGSNKKKPEEPSGPFFRLVKAALSLVGESMGDSAIDSLIRSATKGRRGSKLAATTRDRATSGGLS